MSRRKCKYNEEWDKIYPMFKRSRSDSEVRCDICNVTISIANKGKSDLDQHLSSARHRSNVQSADSSTKVTSFFMKDKLNEKVLAAEVTLAFHVVSHHQSYKSCDCTTKLYHLLFRDSEIASKISSARTKTEAIVNGVLAPMSLKMGLEKIESNVSYVGVCSDGSNHGEVKIFPILVQYFDKEFGIKHIIIEMKSVKDEKAETISKLIFSSLESNCLAEKCIAFGGDNCNTNFGGVRRNGSNNVSSILQSMLQRNLIGIGCPAHILNNCVQHALDGLSLDIESVILKIYNYFSIYTVRIESLKDFCDFVDLEYKKLLSYSKTRWLSLFPAVDRILQLYPALKSYFLSQNQTPVLLNIFFQNEINESYLWFVHSLMYIFHTRIQNVENERNSIIEVISVLRDIEKNLEERKIQSFLPLKVKDILNKNDDNYESIAMKNELLHVYERATQYLKMWTEPLNEFDVFEWITLRSKPAWENIERTVMYLKEKTVSINDSLLFDQSVNLNKFLTEKQNNEEFWRKRSDEKWVEYFKDRSLSASSEFRKICSFYFAIPAHNATIERVFSLMKTQWTNERNRLLPDSVKCLLMVQFNLKSFDCLSFYKYALEDKELLKKVQSQQKYELNTSKQVAGDL